MAKNKEKEAYRFLYSYEERRKQYRTYLKYYNKKYESYGPGMTEKLSYKDYRAIRSEQIINSKRLGVSAPSNKSLAEGQIRISRHAAQVRQRHVKEHIQNAITRELEGKPLSRAQQIELEIGTYWGHTTDAQGNVIAVRRMRKITQKDIINELGVQRDIYEALLKDDEVEDVDNIYGYIE